MHYPCPDRICIHYSPAISIHMYQKNIRAQGIGLIKSLNCLSPCSPGNLLFDIKLINKHFDLRPAGIIKTLDLRRPIYKQTAAYGHFGRPDIDLSWERTDKAEALKKDAEII